MKPKLLFLPSAWSNAAVFQPQINSLSKTYEIEVLDTTQFTSITDTVNFIVKNYKNLHAIIGLSLGGFAALELAAHYPDFVPQIVLIGTQAHAFDEATKQFFLSIIQQVEDGELPKLCSLFVDAVLTDTNKKNSALVDCVAKMPLTIGKQGCINHHKAAIHYQDQTKQLKNIKAKTLILCGAEDQATPIAGHEVLAQHIKNSKLIIVPQAAHFVTLEQPEFVTQQLKDSLD